LDGDAVNCIDNVDRPFGGAAISSILTESRYKDRLLGKNENASVLTTSLWMITGNNLVFQGDIKTRVLICDIDPQVERPEERTFDVDPRKYFLDHRGELIAAGLTILRAFHVAGRPAQGLVPYGRFEAWSDWIRSSLVWCGESDPCETRYRLDEVDPVSNLLRQLLRAWFEQFGTHVVTTGEVVKACELLGPDSHLQEVLLEIAGERDGTVNRRRLGKWIESHQRRIEGGLRVVRSGDRNHTAQWRVEQVSPDSRGLQGLRGSFHTDAGNCQCDSFHIGAETIPRNPGNPEDDGEEAATCPL
jgi:hypothetical protein